MNYNIVTDINELQRFLKWLPILEPHEKYYVCLFARSKYIKHLQDPLVHIKSDKAQLKRFTATDKDLYWKIMQLECPIGSYRQKDVEVPQEALALYITVNPRDCYRAQFSSLTALSKCIQNQNRNANPHQEVMSEIQRTKSRTVVVGFDFDLEEKPGRLDYFIANMLYGEVNQEAVTAIETRGGVHVLIHPDRVSEKYRKTWYNYIKSIPGVDQAGDIMVPIPGTYQGGFTPKLYIP